MYKLLIRLFPSESVFYVYYGLFLESQGKLIEASNLLNYALHQKDLVPDFHFYNNLGYYSLLLYQQNSENSYLRIANDALACAEKYDQANEILLLNWLFFYEVTEDLAQMFQTLEKLLKANPKDLKLLFKTGLVLLALQKSEEAAEYFLNALSFAKNDFEWTTKIRLAYALTLAQSGKEKQANSVIGNAILVVYKRCCEDLLVSEQFLKLSEQAIIMELPFFFKEKTLGFDFEAELQFLKLIIEQNRQAEKDKCQSLTEEIGEEFQLEIEPEDSDF